MRRLLLAVLFVGSCRTPTASLLSGGELAALNRAESQWNARGFGDYVFETRLLCFCPPEITEWNRVEVRGGVITKVELVGSSPPVRGNPAWFETIDSTFARLRRNANDPGFRETYQDIAVHFGASLGFPTDITYSERPGIADAGSTRMIRSVLPLP
jgi:hypothetical protein